MSPQKYLNKVYRVVILAAVGLAFAGVVFAFFPKITQFISYQKTQELLKADIRSKEETIKDLRLKQERFSTDSFFVQQMAHEIGYAHESETVFQFNEPSLTNDGAAQTIPVKNK